MTTLLSGRRAEAARNNDKILEAARAVFIADAHAPIADVAAMAGVGISALYRRFPSKADLLRQLCRDGLQRYISEVETALADDGDPWQTFARFMRRVLDADTHSLTLHLAGTFTPTEDLWRDGQRAHDLTVDLLDRTTAAGVLRPGIEVGDLTLIFEQLAAVRVADAERTRQLRHRYLALLLDALHAPAAVPLPGPPPLWSEIDIRFRR